MIVSLIAAGVGGFFGTACRYLTGVVSKKLFGTGFPWGTFIVNVVGCYIIGLFFGLWDRHAIDPMVNALLITGFCGGFTTFSSFSHDSYSLMTAGKAGKFVIYVAGSVVLGLMGVYLGLKTI